MLQLFMFVALYHVAKRWPRPMQDWKAALHQLVILFGDGSRCQKITAVLPGTPTSVFTTTNNRKEMTTVSVKSLHNLSFAALEE